MGNKAPQPGLNPTQTMVIKIPIAADVSGLQVLDELNRPRNDFAAAVNEARWYAPLPARMTP